MYIMFQKGNILLNHIHKKIYSIMITKYNKFNESLRDKMTPVSPEFIRQKLEEYRKGGEVQVFNEVIGKVAKEIIVEDEEESAHFINFIFEDGTKYEMYHEQDCCEGVYIQDINGDIEDLIGEPLLKAEQVTANDPNASESGMWTFYKFATIKGYVDIRWYGFSNGYYSESVSFVKKG